MSAPAPATRYVYRKDGTYLGPLAGRYGQGARTDGTPWPDCLLFRSLGCGGQIVGINADLANVSDNPPNRSPRT